MIAAMPLVCFALAPSLHAPPRLAGGIARRALIPWREEMQERFEAADDGDGFINSSELGSLMTACGESLSADEVSALFEEADTNGDGKINYPEWNKVMIDSTTRMVRGEKKTGGGGRKLPFIN